MKRILLLLLIVSTLYLFAGLIAAQPQRFYVDWSSLEGWSKYTGWWGSTGVVELSDEVFVSSPSSLHISSRVGEAAYIYGDVPGIDFDSLYNVSLWLYLGSDCDRVIVYQDANLRLAILDNELKVLKSFKPLEWVDVISLEKETWYRISATVDPTTLSAIVSVAEVTVTAKLPPEGIPTTAQTPEGTISWDVTLGDLSHSTGQGDFYIDDLEIVQATVSGEVPAGPFKFKIRLEPYMVRVEKGEPAIVKVKVALVSGTPEQVKLSLVRLGGLPPDFPYTFDPPVVVPPTTSTLRIDTSELEGSYALTVWGQSEGIDVYNVFTLDVISPFDYEISVVPSKVKVKQGESVKVTINVNLVKGEARPIELSISGVPSGASYSLKPTTVTPPGTAELTIDAGEAKGTFHIVVKGVSGEKTKTASLELTIEEKKCVIATATYGSELSGIVEFLRSFRNNFVFSTYAGRRFYVAFDAFYYSWSPTVARAIRGNPWLKLIFRVLLYPLILSLEASALAAQPLISLNPEVAVFVAGAVAATLIGLVYIAPLAYILLRRKEVKNILLALTLVVLVAILASSVAEMLRADDMLTLATTAYVLSLMGLAAIVPLKIVKKLKTSP